MYEVDERDQVVELCNVPKPDAGAPSPAVVADEHTLQLAYICRLSEPEETGGIALVRFTGRYSHMFGFPNDETLQGHPLFDRGLSYYRVFRVEDSSWVRRLERINSVHHRHDPARFEQLNHFIFTFHDSTFECVAREFECEVVGGDTPLNLSVSIAI